MKTLCQNEPERNMNGEQPKASNVRAQSNWKRASSHAIAVLYWQRNVQLTYYSRSILCFAKAVTPLIGTGGTFCAVRNNLVSKHPVHTTDSAFDCNQDSSAISARDDHGVPRYILGIDGCTCG